MVLNYLTEKWTYWQFFYLFDFFLRQNPVFCIEWNYVATHKKTQIECETSLQSMKRWILSKKVKWYNERQPFWRIRHFLESSRRFWNTKPFPCGRDAILGLSFSLKASGNLRLQFFSRDIQNDHALNPFALSELRFNRPFFNLGQTLIFCAKPVEICDLRDRAQNLSPVEGMQLWVKMFLFKARGNLRFQKFSLDIQNDHVLNPFALSELRFNRPFSI